MSEQNQGSLPIRVLIAKLRAVSNTYGGIPALHAAADWLDSALTWFTREPSLEALRELNAAVAYAHRFIKRAPIKEMK
jgi:hypothetical protein